MSKINIKSKYNIDEPRINQSITEFHSLRNYNDVRLIYKEHFTENSENDFNKIVKWGEAIRIANDKGLDLIEINSKTIPIIVRLESYSKYMYNLKKQLKQNRKKTNSLKEIQLSVNISHHDLEIKANKAKEFLKDGDKVKVVLIMKGRELSRREESKHSFYEFLRLMLDSGIASLESAPRDEEKKTYVIFKKK